MTRSRGRSKMSAAEIDEMFRALVLPTLDAASE
jgi:hypothetical protein